MNLKIIFFGTPEFAIPVMESLKDQGWLAAVVTQADQPIGRTQEIAPSPIAQAAPPEIKVVKPDRLDEQTFREIKQLQPDLLVVAAYGKIIPQRFLDIPKFGALNIHPSLLPKYRGPAPLQNTILNGETETGVTIYQMDAEMDHGPVISTSVVTLSENDNYLTLGNKLFQAGADDLIAVLPEFISGKITPKAQNHQEATYTKIISKEDGFFEIDNPPAPVKINRMIRAYYPWPTAWTRWNDKVVKFLPSSSHLEQSEGSKFLIQMEGKKPVPLKNFLNGYPDFPIKNL